MNGGRGATARIGQPSKGLVAILSSMGLSIYPGANEGV